LLHFSEDGSTVPFMYAYILQAPPPQYGTKLMAVGVPSLPGVHELPPSSMMQIWDGVAQFIFTAACTASFASAGFADVAPFQN
jgi:hypothetical protein